jgi:predicted nucleic acid-binding protein
LTKAGVHSLKNTLLVVIAPPIENAIKFLKGIETNIERDEEDALIAMGWMTLGRVVELTQEIVWASADLSLKQKLPMADRIILASARENNAILRTQDEHFKNLPDVKYIEKE